MNYDAAYGLILRTSKGFPKNNRYHPAVDQIVSDSEDPSILRPDTIESEGRQTKQSQSGVVHPGFFT